jgi:hypothetical protein
MTVEAHQGLTNPTRLSATRVLIKDQYGQPIVVVVEYSPDNLIVETAKNKIQFNQLLADFGIKQTAIVTVADSRLGDREIILGEDD